MIKKISYIKKLPNGKYRVYSEKGKHMGDYDSLKGAKKRLQQIEFFKHHGSLLSDLNKLADHLDTLGFRSGADTIDALIIEAAHMSPEEYKRYYGKPQVDIEVVRELDPSTPEGYKRYYGKDKPSLSMEEKPDPVKQIELEENDADWQIELANLIESLRNTKFSRGAKLYVDSALTAGTVVARLRFKSDIFRDAFLNQEMPKLKDFRPISKDKKDQYVAYYDGGVAHGGYIWIKSGTYNDEIFIIVNTKKSKDAPTAKQILQSLIE